MKFDKTTDLLLVPKERMRIYFIPSPCPPQLVGSSNTAINVWVIHLMNYCFWKKQQCKALSGYTSSLLKEPFPGSSMLGCPAAEKLLASLECCHEHVTFVQAPDKLGESMGGQCQACCLPAASVSCPASQQNPGDQEARMVLSLFQCSLGGALPSSVSEDNRHSL